MLLESLVSTDHTVIGLMYAVTSLFFLLVGFMLVVLIRWQLAYPGDIQFLGPGNPLARDRSDPAAKDDITTINQFNLPVNRPVIVHLSSKDVIHGFALPPMRVKQDAIPGIPQPVWFTPTETGAWEIVCSQCDLGHYRMRGFYTIQTQAEFDAWLAEEAALLAQP